MSVHLTHELPEDVQRVIDTDTKATSRERFRKLLRDAYYAGPIPRGSSPERSTGANTSSPGSELRRSRDGALWNLMQKQENILLSKAQELDLIGEHNGEYFTTERGAEVLTTLDTCDCGEHREPHYEERTVKISRYSTGKNHSLTTKCPECDDTIASWNRDEFPPTKSTTDDAERLSRSLKHADLHDAGVGDWMPPERRALNEFIEIVHDEYYSDFDSYLTRTRTPSRLPGGGKALKHIFTNYSHDVCRDFSDLVLDTYYGACLTDVEQGVVAHVAAGSPEANGRDGLNTDHHAMDHTEPIAVIEDDHWQATLRFEATGEYVTIEGHADRTRPKIEYETNSGMNISAGSPRVGRVMARPLPKELRPHNTGDVATIVAFEVLDERAYNAASRVEQAFETITRAVDRDSRNAETQLNSTFKKIASGRTISTSTFGSGVAYDLNNTELVKLSRQIDEWIGDDMPLPALVERYANRELQ